MKSQSSQTARCNLFLLHVPLTAVLFIMAANPALASDGPGTTHSSHRLSAGIHLAGGYSRQVGADRQAMVDQDVRQLGRYMAGGNLVLEYFLSEKWGLGISPGLVSIGSAWIRGFEPELRQRISLLFPEFPLVSIFRHRGFQYKIGGGVRFLAAGSIYLKSSGPNQKVRFGDAHWAITRRVLPYAMASVAYNLPVKLATGWSLSLDAAFSIHLLPEIISPEGYPDPLLFTDRVRTLVFSLGFTLAREKSA